MPLFKVRKVICQKRQVTSTRNQANQALADVEPPLTVCFPTIPVCTKLCKTLRLRSLLKADFLKKVPGTHQTICSDSFCNPNPNIMNTNFICDPQKQGR